MDAMTAAEKKSVEDGVKERFERFVAAVNAMELAAWADFYSNAGFLSAIAGTEYCGSKKAWVEMIKGYFSVRESQNITPVAMRVVALAPDLALMTSEEQTSMRLKEGGENAAKHAFTMLWKKEPEGWKILHSHESWTES